MKTLAHHQLIYDKDCPLCKVYSGAFVKSKMLDKNGRQNYRDLPDETKSIIDLDRARNEIALVNHTNKEVYYGLNTLLIIIGHSFPLLEKIGRIPFVYSFFQKLYSFVSYNRKQIIPSKNDTLQNACVPDFNLKYRLIFLGFGVIYTSYFLPKIFLNFGFQMNYLLSFILVLGFYFWQSAFIFKNSVEHIFNYLGNFNTISLLGIFILYLVSVLNFPASMNLSIIVFFLLAVEHYRREKILKINIFLTFSFIIYPVLVYLLYKLKLVF